MIDENASDLTLETWILDTGDAIIAKRSSAGEDSLSDLEQLIMCLWAADYGMRNAGDLEAADEVNEGFLKRGAAFAAKIDTPQTLAAFNLSKEELEAQYFDRLGRIVAELSAQYP